MRELRHICGARKTLPTSSALSSQVLLISNQPVASGGSGDVYEGSLNNLRVCVKRVRVYARDSSGEPPDVRHLRYYFGRLLLLMRPKTFFKEAVVWKRLKHKNIVPLICVSVTPFQLISEWMPGGDLTEYVGKHPEADRLSLVSVPPAPLDATLTPTASCVMLLKVFSFFTPATWSMAISRG